MFVPDEEAARQIEAWSVATAPGLAVDAFPGWDPAAQVLALPLPASGSWCLSRTPWTLGRPVAARDGGTLAGITFLSAQEASGLGFPGTVASAGGAGAEAPVCVFRGVPIVIAEPASVPADMAARVFTSLFRLWWASKPGREIPQVPLLPETPAAAALSAVEGRLLLQALAEVVAGPPPAAVDPAAASAIPRLLTQIALVRRERRADFGPEREADEQALEVGVGLSRYVGARCARPMAAPGAAAAEGQRFRPHGVAPCASPPPELSAGLADLASLPFAQRCGYSGWALSLLLDAVESLRGGTGEDAVAARRPWAQRPAFADGWRAALASGAAFDPVLELHVRFDGGSRDEAALAAALAAHGHTQALEQARALAAEAGGARRALVDGILQGEGTLVAIDIRELGVARVEAPTAAQAVHAGLAVYPDGASFSFGGGTRLHFHRLPVAEDRRSGLLQTRVQARLRLHGDGTAIVGGRPATFSDGLDLTAPGIRLRAARGTIESIEGGYLLRLIR